MSGGGGDGDLFDRPLDDVDSMDDPISGEAILGEWAYNGCAQQLRTRVLVDEATMLWRSEFFSPSDGSCQTSYATLLRTEDYRERGRALSPATATKIDLTTQGVQFIPHLTPVADAWNQSAFCGYVDWVPDQPKNVDGHLCDDVYMPSIGDTTYQVHQVVDGRWHFGDVSTGTATSDATRPTTLEAGYYVRP